MWFKSKCFKGELLNAIFYINKTGYQYRYLRSDYSLCQSAHIYLTKLTNEGTFKKISDFLREKTDQKKTLSLVCIDSQIVKGDANLEIKELMERKKRKEGNVM